MALKENYKDDILDVSVNTKRKYRMTENPDGTISLEDETVYTQQGDSFGASDMNATNGKVNTLESDIGEINDKLTWTASSPISDALEHDLPSSFSEMIIKANLGSYVIMTIHVLRDMLRTFPEYYRVGYSGIQGISAYVSFSITDTKIKFQNGALNGTALASVSYKYWYR